MRRFLSVVLLWLLTAGPAAANFKEQCLGCHEDSFSSPGAKAVLGFDTSPHGALDCVGCHADAKDFPHAKKPGKVNCASCHEAAEEKYRAGVHGQKSRDGDELAATCTDCHGTHDIRRNSDPESRTYPLHLPATCGSCHNGQAMAKRPDVKVPNAYAEYLDSAHGKGLIRSGLLVSAACDDCHGAHDIQPASVASSTLSRLNTPKTCGKCHVGTEDEYLAGTHGQLWSKGDEKVPVCTTCHSGHGVKSSDQASFKLEVIGGCGSCHKEQIDTYRETYHGQVTALGFVAVAKCSDCHNYHDVLPSRNPASPTNAKNLVATCAKCHPGASENFVKFEAHGDHRDPQNYPHLYYTYLFMTTLLTGTFVFFGIHSFLWLFRALRERRAHGKA